MFRVVEIGKAGLFRRSIKLEADEDMTARRLFGSGDGKTTEYEVRFSKGETTTVRLPKGTMINVGDAISVHTLFQSGHFQAQMNAVRDVS